MNKYKILVILSLSVVVFSQCTIKTTEKLVNQQEEDFDLFLEKFLTDSTFQMSRIVFPVKGLPVSVSKDVFENGYNWTADNWDIHIKVDYKKDGYRRVLQNTSEIIKEQLIHPNGWFVERRFKKTKGQWFLIYYVAPNSINLIE